MNVVQSALINASHFAQRTGFVFLALCTMMLIGGIVIALLALRCRGER